MSQIQIKIQMRQKKIPPFGKIFQKEWEYSVMIFPF